MILQLKPLFMGEIEHMPIQGEIDLSSVEVAGICPFQRPVRVQGEAGLFSGVIALHATAFYRYDGPCDRCATPISREMETAMDHILVTSLNHEDNDELLLVENYRLSLDELAVADILLDFPSKLLCREDCRGLCHQCGKNLNEGLCGCSTKEVDPRLAALQELLN
ncbi:MAG: DUF177 domain-containing protein [Clostridiales bacterium]|nr:DUF177 domain-containing protein [Clostridiales bacterium]